ncbi:phosphatidate cytidylyltransferase [Halovulum dunhuangense]|nr:phosphatidate cytidylyltransferase [Halovulum dunhuangense]
MASAAVLIAIALIDFWRGGLYVTILVMAGTGLMLWEYRRIVLRGLSLSDRTLWIMAGSGAACVAATGLADLPYGVAALAVGLVLTALSDRARIEWMLPGLAYIALPMAILVDMRADPAQGFPLVLWLVCVVIAADVGAYFAGRLIGGPKLWPRLSPKKTWAGAIGGLVAALIVGTAFLFSGHVSLPVLVLLSGIMAVASMAGDLLESWLKRRYGVKDASSLIPGHGGLLDRFDGLIGALWAYALLGMFFA